MANQPAHFEPRFGSFVLETLTLGMYGESRNAIREYIQNSFDSLHSAIADGLLDAANATVEIELRADALVIRDNGGGLSEENAVDVLASIGASTKDYKENAGFRGIGRLAGIVFANTLTFRTKAQGETRETVVAINAAKLREDLAPSGANTDDAAATLRGVVDAYFVPDRELDDHYFEVELSGFENPPAEATNATLLRSYLCQVAPLPYAPDFQFAQLLTTEAAESEIEAPTINLFLKTPASEGEKLYKLYGGEYSKGRRTSKISGVKFYRSPTKRWWGWVGDFNSSGAFTDPKVSGLRVRVRNIQIDGTELVRDIFASSQLGKGPRSSYGRFADWYVGEIFVAPDALVPNARRDGFEENPAWKTIRDEIDTQIATPLGREAYAVSSKGQLSIDSLSKKLSALEADEKVAGDRGDVLVRARVVQGASEMVQKASKAAAQSIPEERDAVHAILARATELNKRAIAASTPEGGCELKIARAKSDLVQRLYKAFKRRLSPIEFQKVRKIVHDESGEDVK